VIVLGPLLYARGTQNHLSEGDRWRLSVALLLSGEAEPPDLRADGVHLPIPPRHLHEWPAGALPGHPLLRLWRYDFAVPRGPQESRVLYGFEGEERRWAVTVPGTRAPLRIAYAACGGCEDESEIPAAGLARNARWGHLLGRHRAEPLHLLLMGGDQVYADGLWQGVPALARVAAETSLTRRARLDLPAAEAGMLAGQLDAWYLRTYHHGWSQAETAAVLASVPMVCMWDDHDIIDGWGSHPAALLDSPVYQAVFGAAARAFHLIQLGMAADAPAETLWGAPESFSLGLRVNDVGILAPDLRSGRRPDRVLHPADRDRFVHWLDRLRGCRHLLFMSSVPLIYPDLGMLERLLALIPGRQRLEDDLRDQWRSPAHREEWAWLLDTLMRFSTATGCQVTSLSGEVHLGTQGVVRGAQGVELWQLTSSGIVHPPPPEMAVAALERLGRRTDRLPGGAVLEIPPFPETGRRTIARRNWLSLLARPEGTLSADWQAEGEPAVLHRDLPPPRLPAGAGETEAVARSGAAE